MIRGLYVGRPAVAGAITFSIFACKVLSKFLTHPIIDIMINPIVVFCLFLVAGMVIFYPKLKGFKALIIMPMIVIVIAFFVYAYYVLP